MTRAGIEMAVMTQEQLKQLVRGGCIVDDSSMDVQLRYMTDIAITALGDDIEALRVVLTNYADELEALVNYAYFFTPSHKRAAQDHIEWLRSF